MSSDPHPPTPSGSDPDETTEFRPPAAADPFAPSGDSPPSPSDADREPAATSDADRGSSETSDGDHDVSSVGDGDRDASSVGGGDHDVSSVGGGDRDAFADERTGGEAADLAGSPEPAFDPPTESDASLEEPSSPATLPPVATPEVPTDAPASEGDWLGPDAGASAATSEPDPVVRTPSSFTPLGTPESSPKSQLQELTDRPEVMVALAFVGGALVSLVLKRFGR